RTTAIRNHGGRRMRRTQVVTERELREIEDLAGELITQRCHEDRKFLRRLVRAYLGEAEAAEDAVLERCAGDSAYLESVVKNYLNSLDEHELLNTLRASAGVSTIIERLKFDPFDPRRREAYRLAHSFINRRSQGIVLGIGVGAFFLLCLFPPIQEVRWQREEWKWSLGKCSKGSFFGCCPPPDRKAEVRYAGHFSV